ncbi:MAG: YraN family protein [Gemmatimonadota bacterium]
MSRTRRFIPADEWSDARQRRGLAGEQAAIAFLTSCGWFIESHRFRCGRHEIDLVIRKGEIVAFVEVKTRRTPVCGTPWEAISLTKRRRIAKVAEIWTLRYGRPGDIYRFDAAAVWEDGYGLLNVEHLEDAWRIHWPARG